MSFQAYRLSFTLTFRNLNTFPLNLCIAFRYNGIMAAYLGILASSATPYQYSQA